MILHIYAFRGIFGHFVGVYPMFLGVQFLIKEFCQCKKKLQMSDKG